MFVAMHAALHCRTSVALQSGARMPGCVLQKLHIGALLRPKNGSTLTIGSGKTLRSEESVMMAHAALQNDDRMPRRFVCPRCPRCNDMLFAAAASEHVSDKQIRHTWSCDSCGHEFATSVRLAFVGRPQLCAAYS